MLIVELEKVVMNWLEKVGAVGITLLITYRYCCCYWGIIVWQYWGFNTEFWRKTWA